MKSWKLFAIVLLSLTGGFGRVNGQTLTSLYSFTGGNDGADPEAGLVQGSDGNFYGTTLLGGASTNYSQLGVGYGTVFRVSPSGSFTNLHSFSGDDGANPFAPLVQGNDGNFYGTTYYGGNPSHGTVFRISPSGSFTSLHSFSISDGANPLASLVQGSDGNFYGTTFSGGAYGGGTIFRISPSGNHTNLHSFGASRYYGAYPGAGLVQGSDGNFYGTASESVVRISPSGTFTGLYCLGSSAATAGLVQGSDGNFYGMNNASAFRISANGTFASLYDSGGSGLLVQGSDGNFYGVNGGAGAYGEGTVFRLSVPLNPPANQISSVQPGSSGTNLVFGIPSVAGETYQLQFTTDLTSGIWSNVPGVSVTNSIGALLTLTNFGGAVGRKGFIGSPSRRSQVDGYVAAARSSRSSTLQTPRNIADATERVRSYCCISSNRFSYRWSLPIP